MTEAGLDSVSTIEAKEKLLVVLMRQAVSFSSLSKFFGENRSLAYLAALEARHV